MPEGGRRRPEHVVKVQVFMTDITERPKINPRRIAYFGNNLPVSTLVEVKGLVDPRVKVEIECPAYVSKNGEPAGGTGAGAG